MNYINKVGLRNVMYGKLPSGPSLHSACYSVSTHSCAGCRFWHDGLYDTMQGPKTVR